MERSVYGIIKPQGSARRGKRSVWIGYSPLWRREMTGGRQIMTDMEHEIMENQIESIKSDYKKEEWIAELSSMLRDAYRMGYYAGRRSAEEGESAY